MTEGRKNWARVLAAGTAALALAVAGCSDDGGDSGGGATDEPAPELTGPPVKLMVTGAFDAFDQDYTQIPEAAQAAADAIEADGGINGGPIEIIECNQTDVNSASDCGRMAVDEDVIATVGTFSTFGAEYLPILQEAGIPQVAPFPIAFEDFTAEINYPIMGGSLSTTGGMGAQLADAGDDAIAVAYLDIAQGALAAELVATGSDPRGAEIVASVGVPDGTVEFSSFVAQTLDADPSGIAVVLAQADTPGFIRALAQSGYEGDIAASTSGISVSALNELGDVANGMLFPNNFLPPTYTKNATVQQFNDELDQYAPADIVRTDGAQNAWAGVHLVATLLEGKTADAATLTQALDDAPTIDVGFAPEFNFKKGITLESLAPGLELRIFNNTVVYCVWEDGQLNAVDGEFVDPLEG